MHKSPFHFTDPIQYENLTLHFLLGPSVPPDYLTLAEGCRLNIVEILETGTVGRLTVHHRSPKKPLFIQLGEPAVSLALPISGPEPWHIQASASDNRMQRRFEKHETSRKDAKARATMKGLIKNKSRFPVTSEGAPLTEPANGHVRNSPNF